MFYFLLLFIVIGAWSAWSYYSVATLEAPQYEVDKVAEGYEVRTYTPYIVAETSVTGDYDAALNAGFRVIADYIFGNNLAKQNIKMTAPVLEEGQLSEKIAMTVPVLENAQEQKRIIGFVMPSEYTMETIPTPINDVVQIREVGERQLAVHSYRFFATPTRIESKKQELLAMIERDGLTSKGEVISARYNPPLSMPLFLYNEVMVEVERK